MRDYADFVNYIKEKTGISLYLFDKEGNALYGGGKISLPPVLNEIYSDTERDKTFFPIAVKSKLSVAAINGSGANEKKFAVFISELADNFSLKDGLSKTEFFKSLLLGEINYSQTLRYALKFDLPKTPCFTMIISLSSGRISDIKNVLLSYGDEKNDVFVYLKENQCALVKFCDKQSEEYRSQGEYAEYLLQSVYEETGLTPEIYIGGKVKTPHELTLSFSQARAAENFSKSAGAAGNVHSYKEFVILSILEELPRQKLKEYADILTDEGAKEIFDDEEMVATAEEFLNSSLNVSETARNLYLHRNTLTYRLDKIEKATGLNIRKFPDALTFRLITYLNKIVK